MNGRASILVFFSLWLSFSGLMAQENARYTFHDGDSSKLKEVYMVRPGTQVLEGKYISYYLNGKIESEGSFESNEAVGEWKFFYETGKLKMKMEVTGQDAGYWQYFYENGNMSMEGNIVDQVRSGKWKLYYESGALKSTGNFASNKMEGPWQFYYEDGKLKGEIEYMNNKGLFREYYPTGELKAEGPKSGFKNTGRWKYYFKEGQVNEEMFVEAEGNYLNGKKIGEWHYYFLSGNLSAKGSYLNDKPEGTWEYFYEDGSVSSSGEFAQGFKNGMWDLFFNDGTRRGSGTFEHGTGEYIEYYRDQKVKVRGQLVDGKNHGKWKYYYPSGVLEGECEFAHGRGVYYGYYPDGTLQTKGIIQDDRRIGTWELYENDGKLSGYYKPYYEGGELVENTPEINPVQPRKLPAANYRSRNRGFRYFDSRINEFRGVILSANPFMSFVGRFPLAVEFYVQERIGHEFEFEGIRKPFFMSDVNVPIDEVYSRGYSISIRQKFYHEIGAGLWYFGHELQFANKAHNANVILPILPDTPVKVSASEQNIQYHIITGYRLMESTSRKGYTLDIFGGLGVGYRNFNVDDEYGAPFLDLPKEKVPILFRIGFTMGYVMAVE